MMSERDTVAQAGTGYTLRHLSRGDVNEEALLPAPELDLAGCLEPREPLRATRCLDAILRGDDRAAYRPGDLLEPARHVHDVADDGELDALPAAEIAYRHRTAVDSDRHAKRIWRRELDLFRFQRSISCWSSKAQASARAGASGCRSMEPKVAMKPSPRYLSSVPPCLNTMALLRSWKLRSKANVRSGERVSVSLVKPTMTAAMSEPSDHVLLAEVLALRAIVC